MPSRDDVYRAARLARLSPSAKDLDRMTDELNEILSGVEVLAQYAREDMVTSDDSPGAGLVRDSSESHAGMVHDTSESAGRTPSLSRLRSDTPGADPLSIPPAYLAPEWRDGFFTVPRLPTHDMRE